MPRQVGIPQLARTEACSIISWRAARTQEVVPPTDLQAAGCQRSLARGTAAGCIHLSSSVADRRICKQGSTRIEERTNHGCSEDATRSGHLRHPVKRLSGLLTSPRGPRKVQLYIALPSTSLLSFPCISRRQRSVHLAKQSTENRSVRATPALYQYQT